MHTAFSCPCLVHLSVKIPEMPEKCRIRVSALRVSTIANGPCCRYAALNALIGRDVPAVQAGIVGGVIAAVLVVLALVVIFLIVRRRRQAETAAAQYNGGELGYPKVSQVRHDARRSQALLSEHQILSVATRDNVDSAWSGTHQRSADRPTTGLLPSNTLYPAAGSNSTSH